MSEQVMPKPPSAWRWLIAPAVLCMAALSGPEARPQAPAIKEYEIKAVFLLNFAQFVEWPAHAFANDTAPLTLGVLGEDPFGNILDRTVQGETIKGRPLAVKRFKRIEDVQDCHLLFISRSEKARVPQILSRLAGTSILTVGETDQFARSGGIINFRIQGNNVRFEINVDAAARSHLKISSKLLRLATIITNGRAKEGG